MLGILIRRARRQSLPALSLALSLAVVLGTTPAPAGLFDQDALITQNSLDYVYFQSEWFDLSSSNSATPPGSFDNTMWTVNHFPAAPAIGKSVLSPTQANNNNPNNALLTYNITFTDPGLYTFYAFRNGGGNDSMFPPPAFNANPDQAAAGGVNQNRWNSLANDTWSELGVTGDFPPPAYFTTGAGARKYEVTAAQVGTPLEFRFGAREANTQFDRFVLHKTAGLNAAALNALSFSTAVVNNPVPEPTFSFTVPAGVPQGGNGFMGIREVINNGAMNDQNNAHTSLQSGAGTIQDYTAPLLNIRDSDGNGRFGNDALFRSDPDQVNPTSDTVNNIALVAQGVLRVPAGQAGNHTFGVNSDDGFTLMFPGKSFASATNGGLPIYNGNRALQFFGGRGASDTLGVVNLPAGDHPFVLTFHEGGGGAAVELFSAPGSFTDFSQGPFALIGQQAGPIVPKKAGMISPAGWDLTVIRDGDANLAASITRMENHWSGAVPGMNVATGTGSVVNLTDPQAGGGNKPGYTQTPFPGDQPVDENNFAAGARASLTIDPADAGDYTFMVLSDDSFRFRLPGTAGWTVAGAATPSAIADGYQTAGCCGDAFGTVNLAAGTYPVEMIMNEIGGGAYVGVWAAKGTWSSYNDAFQLLGENIMTQVPTQREGLQLVPEPGSIALAFCGLGMAIFAWRKRRSR
jgi:hypothetical protein